MAGVIRVKRNGSWAPARGLYVKQSGSWTPAEKAFIKKDGEWVQIYPADAAIFSSTPSSLSFTVYKTFTSTSQRLVINNTGTADMTINRISVSQTPEFTTRIELAGMGGTSSNVVIPPGQTKYIDVSVTGNTEGSYTSYINFDYSIGVLGNQSSRVAVNTTVQPQYSTLLVTPSAISYSTYFTGPSPKRIIKIYNNGNGGVMTINSITSASGLTDISNYGTSVASGSYIEVTITAPSGRSPGTHGDTIFINTSAGNDTVPVTLTVDALSSGMQEYATPGTYSWTVPTGITSITAYIMGAGGGGGGSTEVGNGAGGGGGGSGGYLSEIFSTTPGEILTITVGTGGDGAPYVGRNAGALGQEGPGKDGTFSAISGSSGTRSAGGGFGGQSGRTTSTNYGPGFGGAGGYAGSPGGAMGETGTSGTADNSSTYGGTGGASNLAPGGAPGTPGRNGSRGSGGGGASAPDRVSPYNWAGGRGGDGYVRISW